MSNLEFGAAFTSSWKLDTFVVLLGTYHAVVNRLWDMTTFVPPKAKVEPVVGLAIAATYNLIQSHSVSL